MNNAGAAEHLLKDLGVTTPAEIDLEAIAYYLGARVRFGHLHGCEARIIGTGDRAVITVNSRSPPRRQRFSIAHELGHWHFHRGRKLICRVEEMERDVKMATSPERVADNYAAELLMPNYLFKPLVRKYSALNFSTVSEIANIFESSYTATAIRLVESDEIPGFLICHGRFGRKWFTRSPSIPGRWFPKGELDEHSHAFGVLYGGKPANPAPYRISADAWFDVWGASEFKILEQTMRLGENEALTLLAISDPKMLEDPEETRSR
jgi:hypothetical protein